MKHLRVMIAVVLAVSMGAVGALSAQSGSQRQTGPGTKPAPPPLPDTADFVIGAADVLRIDVVGEPTMSGDFVVRPDGKITMLQIDEVVAAGMKPEELKKKIKTELKRFYEEPVPEVIVQIRQINSRVVYLQGAVNRQGPIPIVGEMRIAQAITLAGGLQEFANKKKILVISGTQKKPNGDPITWTINYEELMLGKNLQKNNILLNPGDQVIVRGG